MNESEANGEANALLIKQQCESTKQQQVEWTETGRSGVGGGGVCGSVGNASTIVSAVVNPCVVLVIMKIHNLRSTKKKKCRKTEK